MNIEITSKQVLDMALTAIERAQEYLKEGLDGSAKVELGNAQQLIADVADNI